MCNHSVPALTTVLKIFIILFLFIHSNVLITSLLCRYHAQEGGRGEVAHIKDSDSRRFDEGLDVELLESYLLLYFTFSAINASTN